jgi:glycosyltransferase involved in cell wall biosynthesis
MEYPKISILIPTLNAVNVLEDCLKSISIQDYPKELIEIIVADGGSTDGTRNIVAKYGAKLIENPLKTAEAGKMVALKVSTGEYIALIDSDNILPGKNWLKQMVEPLLKNPEALGSEPIQYTWRKEDGFITRYCALIGMNDPLVMFLGNYDRINLITGKWTETPHDENDRGSYLSVRFDKKGLPTIGANGTVFRSGFLKKFTKDDYLFDIDILANELSVSGYVDFIKIKNGIVHTYCESDIRKFIRKQERRVRDYLFFMDSKNLRTFNWSDMDIGSKNSVGIIKFVIYCVTIIPLIAQSLIGYRKKADAAWFFHPLACEITFFVYAWHRIFAPFYKKELSRDNWKQ